MARVGEPGAGAEGEMSELSRLASLRSSELVERVLATAREQLGMEVAFVSEPPNPLRSGAKPR